MRLLILEIVFVGLVVAGVAVIFWPAGLILAGVAGVFACERAATRTSDAATRTSDAGEVASR